MEERLTPTQSRLPEPTQFVVFGGVTVLVVMTWFDLWRRASEMHMHMGMAMAMPRQSPWGLADLGSTAVMWGVMMIAMMLPSAMPMLVLFVRSQRPRLGPAEGSWRAGLLVAGYLIVWLGWSGLAAGLQWALNASLLLSPGAAVTSALAGGTLLVLAGVYQLSSWKYACLVQCQSPLGFLLARWRDGRWGAFRMGIAHGLYCVGCCWALMALLFVGGVMNLIWIAALAVFVLLEKAVVRGRWFSYASGGGLVAWGLYVLRAGLLPAS
jgi:predicted metal-binding membrane protein